VLSYKVRPYPEPFLFYSCKSDYFTLCKHFYAKKTCFPKFLSIFFTKERKFTTQGKTNAGGLREDFFFLGGGEPSPLGKVGGGEMVSYFKVKKIVEIAYFRP
jgi:hypothetical protein